MASEFQDRGLVAITGANGTIGYASVIHALRTGYRVRCVLRREEAIQSVKSGPSLKNFGDKLEYAIVPDNTVPGAYDSALEGAKHVVHIAGVWPKPKYHPDHEIYYPFVKSMENILCAAEKSGTVRRIVFTQAGAALVNPNDGDTLGSKMEEVLNEYVKINPQSASFRPPLASTHHAYCGGKAYCMTYLNTLRKEKKLSFSIVQLAVTSSSAYDQMDRMSKALLFNDPKPRYGFGFVHVEDCAAVPIEALDEDKGSDGDRVWKHAGDVVEESFREEVKKGIYTVGRTNLPINMSFRVDSRLTERLLLDGRKFTSLEECVKEVGVWYAGPIKREEEERKY
ncbi:3-beta hydroxysteroid dehydrogenase/isomerase family protein [Pleomassaria siparia CBS 279.74]|uniref:3-beta hydroxysteroid dehydrogenase/isomerase family protein n=1 Tax=Pleomassaria siparia CBS 279.74 TaxID=1314801 RepID=A0A6G1KQ84_9PLEO|nr:3-beta hydroxysteroid dehydrogenase/isomerase family protein [Pleomassaria siparia CBS 279.74]